MDARDQLLAALQDGALKAEGQLSTVADDARPARNWPDTKLTVLSSEPSGPITTDWWIGTNLNVEISWHANAMWRRVGQSF